MDLVIGKNYYIEIASYRKSAYGIIEGLQIKNPYGYIIEEDVGVWCICGMTKALAAYRGKCYW